MFFVSFRLKESNRVLYVFQPLSLIKLTFGKGPWFPKYAFEITCKMNQIITLGWGIIAKKDRNTFNVL
jgi:hypothetical protein